MADIMHPPQHPQPQQQDVKPQMSPPGSLSPIPNPNSARRPPRKSTLTQQQKNQKRQRATQDQLMLLEVEFNKNPTPTALVRERIAQDINMTERSVQIWFQNRRAKIKNIAKRSIESGEDCDTIPDSMRQYLAMQQYGSGKGIAASLLSKNGPGLVPYGSGMLGINGENANGKVVIQHFACRSLSIGTWRRVGQSTMDLVIFYSPDKACITYYINNDSAGYKIEFPFAWIKNISLEQGDVISAAEGASQRAGGLVIELTRPPKFYMDSSGSGGFYECGDFTEDQQASQIMVHHLGGPSKVLSGQLAKLVSLEAYQNRHNFFEPNAFAVSAPVSPVGYRPQSQPIQMAHPPNPMSLYPPDQAPGLMGPPGPRGHKRQRSRSVPVAMDFSMLRHPMPSFLIQHDGQAPAPMQDPNIYAPIPQHQHANGFAPGPIGPNLSIDTSAPYAAFQFGGGPMSATTANSPSDFGTPAFFTSAPLAESINQTHFSTPFSAAYLAVDPSSMIGTSNTPLSVVSHGDPVIANHSPPLSGIGRSQSADIFGTPDQHSQFGDEGMYLHESFNKQMSLPFRSPLSEETFHSPMPDNTYNFHSPPPSGPDMHGQHQAMSFHSPSNRNHDGSMTFQSPSAHSNPQQLHQDSGVSFSTPPQGSHDPTDTGMVYHDSKMYSSPGQLQHLANEQSMYHGTPREELDMQNLGLFGTIDPNSLGQNHQQH
ncbi:hypothetical protein LTR37_020793 [Vermiconidia calcicola]|uniref:Uncharacterized protein n=1 Tax=Vermiconidia calcicola TaxID=1690605 RepID=A0ACC3MAE7_9PEZI|nr:hypothetical protein LTR37_020793 [Vermiconidia calcicola]